MQEVQLLEQLVHTEAPAAEYDPEEHVAQVVFPVPEAYVPGEHGVQDAFPESEAYVPGEHGVHSVLYPPFEYCPDGQSEQADPLKYFPGAHSVRLH